MFTQRLSMDCTKQQYEKYLKDELLKMGYDDTRVTFWEYETIIVNYHGGKMEGLSTLSIAHKTLFERTYLGSFNAPLFLALAAMTDKAEGNYGEYFIGKCSGDFYIMNDVFRRYIHIFNVRKANKEEIMAKFGKTETDTNYDAAKEFVEYFCDRANNLKVAAICDNIHQFTKKAIEKENAIKLLRENGYKILKPKTWEEV